MHRNHIIVGTVCPGRRNPNALYPMTDIPAAVHDPQRLQILKDYDILDTPPEPEF